jgi:ABC-type transport system involved in Fe-S cluster assembly fused permease/ATPase subunit
MHERIDALMFWDQDKKFRKENNKTKSAEKKRLHYSQDNTKNRKLRHETSGHVNPSAI